MIDKDKIYIDDIDKLPMKSTIFSTVYNNATMLYDLEGIEKSWEYLYSIIAYSFTGEKISDDIFINCLIDSFEERSRLENVNRKNRETRDEWMLKESNRVSRKNISTKLRAEVLHRDNYKCKHCGRGPEDGVKLHVDHIMPYSKGGSNDISNLQTLCAECNMGKGNNEWN